MVCLEHTIPQRWDVSCLFPPLSLIMFLRLFRREPRKDQSGEGKGWVLARKTDGWLLASTIDNHASTAHANARDSIRNHLSGVTVVLGKFFSCAQICQCRFEAVVVSLSVVG